MVVEDRIAPLPYFGRMQKEVQQVDLTPPLLEGVGVGVRVRARVAKGRREKHRYERGPCEEQ